MRLRVVEQRRVHRQPVGPFLDPLQRAEFVGFDERPRSSQLVVGDQVGRQPVEFLVEGRLDAGDIDARADRGPAGADRRATHEAEREQGDILGDPLVADEAAIEPAALAAGQDLPGDIERVEPRCPRRPAPGTR